MITMKIHIHNLQLCSEFHTFCMISLQIVWKKKLLMDFLHEQCMYEKLHPNKIKYRFEHREIISFQK